MGLLTKSLFVVGNCRSLNGFQCFQRSVRIPVVFHGLPVMAKFKFEEFLRTFKLLSCFDRFSDDYKRPREFPFFYSSYPFPVMKKAHCRDCPFYFEPPVKIAKVFFNLF